MSDRDHPQTRCLTAPPSAARSLLQCMQNISLTCCVQEHESGSDTTDAGLTCHGSLHYVHRQTELVISPKKRRRSCCTAGAASRAKLLSMKCRMLLWHTTAISVSGRCDTNCMSQDCR